MKKIIIIAAALALGAGAAYAQDKASPTDKIKAAGEANTKAVNEARAKKRAEEEARSKKNKEARDKNPGGDLKKQVNETQKGMDEQRAKNKDAKKPKY
jgi:opacity protein-like surface antigen